MSKRIGRWLSRCVCVALLACVAWWTPASACTTARLGEGDGLRVVKSYDWDVGAGWAMINRRGVAKRALLMRFDAVPLQWTSRYGSLTFNQYGREFPNGGMNEAGLVVEIMWLNSSEYPRASSLPAVNELQWIQYALDTQASVAELVKAADAMWVAPVYAKVHYMACDRSGACATFEYIDGKLVVHHGEDLPAAALTNHDYASSLAYLRRHKGFGGERSVKGGSGSLDRFVRAARHGERGATSVTQGFEILDDVSMGDYTRWQIVYDPHALTVAFRTREHKAVKTLALKPLFAAGCEVPVQGLDLAQAKGGDVASRLVPMDGAANRALVRETVGDLVSALPDGVLDMVAAYPERLPCQP